MTQVNQPSGSVVPTVQRPINGALSGLAAQIGGNAATAYMMAHGVDPGTASVLGTAAGSTVSGVFATVGDWSRGVLSEGKSSPVGRLFLMLFSRIG